MIGNLVIRETISEHKYEVFYDTDDGIDIDFAEDALDCYIRLEAS